MSEITQPPPDVQTQDPNARVKGLKATSDHSTSNKNSAEQNQGQPSAEVEQEKQASSHDPAVTLASTLSKLDSGSYFTATVSGQDGDGRTIITSELGTYLVEVAPANQAEFKKIQSEELLEVKVLTVDKEIKAEVTRAPNSEFFTQNSAAIQVELVLTDLTNNLNPTSPQITSQTPLDIPIADVRSQYQATTLYKAERIAREIAEKLDNLPLPTSSPNYVVYGSSAAKEEGSNNSGPRQVSANVFIQEVGTGAQQPNLTTSQATATKLELNQILNQAIPAQVIKAIPRSPIPLPPGLPEAVIKEITALTPLDYVQAGQNLSIQISALAIPETRNNVQISAQNAPDGLAASNSGQPNSSKTSTETAPASKPQNNLETPKNENVATNTVTKIAESTVSGIIIDTSKNAKDIPTTSQSTVSDVAVANTLYNQNKAPQASEKSINAANKNRKNYYIATPTAVLKIQSNTPLVAGTIVNFTVQNSATTQSAQPSSNVQPSIPATALEQSATTTATEISKQVEALPLQHLDQLPDDWASISLALSVLSSSGAANLAAALSSRIPNMQSPEQLTSTMFFFLSALKVTQPARTWLGPDISSKIKQLGAGKIIDRLDGDIARIARMGADSPVGEWRPHLIPMQNGSDVSAIAMLTKQIVDEKDQKGNEGKNTDDPKINATRFILELKFSQFGMVLVDGLLKGSKLDIILKSVKSIPLTIKMKLSEQYSAALSKNNFEGELIIVDRTKTDLSIRKTIEAMTHKHGFKEDI